MQRFLYILLLCFSFSFRLSAQYCAASHQNTCSPSPTTQQNILDSIWSSTNMSVAIPGCWTNAPYYNLTGPNSTLGIVEGTPFTFSVKAKMPGGASFFLWIDLNRDERWSVNEYFNIGIVSNGVGTFSKTIFVPIGSAGVPTKARLRLARGGAISNNPASEACFTYSGGSTYDFSVAIAPAQACAGVPVKPVLNRTVPALCSYDTAAIYSTTFYTDAGVTYLWQTSTNQGAAWATAPGTANQTSYTISGSSFSVPTHLRLRVTCANGGSTFSDSVLITRKPVVNCPCLPQHAGTCQLGDLLRSASTSSGWRPTFPTQCASNSTLYQWLNATDTLYLTPGTRDSLLVSRGTNFVAVYMHIDYNKNGTFETTENTNILLAANLGVNFKVPFLIPAGIPTGYTTGRIRVARGMSSTNGCGILVEGQTYLFHVKVVPATPCTGVQPTTISVASTSVCPNDSISISAAGFDVQTGKSHIWERSTDGGTTWARMGGRDSVDVFVFRGIQLLAGPVQVRLRSSCVGTPSPVYSNVITFTKGTVAQCNCTPMHGGTCTSADLLNRFQRLNTPFILTLPTACTSTRTSYYTISGTSTDTLNVQAGTSVPLTFRNGGSAMSYSLWIDSDRDSLFALTEWYDLGRNIGAAALRSVSIAIPSNAVNGVARARIRSRLTGSNNGPLDACTSFGVGYTYDFFVVISGGITSLNGTLASAFRAYPNPTTGKLHLEGLEQGTATEVYVHDLMGKEVTTPVHLGAGANEFNMGAVPGVYVLKVVQAGKVHVQRVVVQ